MTPAAHLLIVDDDAGIREVVSAYLSRHGFAVDTAADARQMRERLAVQPYALVVLDLMLPGEDGLSVLRALQRNGGPPVIMLSAAGSDVDRIVGLEIGAEDYLAKPCNPRELLARIRTVLRRVQAAPQPTPVAEHVAPEGDVRVFAGWRFDLLARTLHDPAHQPVKLSDGEFRLLRAFVQHPRRVLSRDQLLEYAGGADSDSYDRAIDVQVSRLRRRLTAGAEPAELVRTVRNEGYMFVPVVQRG